MAKVKPCDHDSRPIYEKLIEPIRARARELGYAIAVHGTLKRDIDLVACPWALGAVEPKELAEAVRIVAAEVHGAAVRLENDPLHDEGCPGIKPFGRLTWTFHLGGGPYIDLSVMPKGEAKKMPWEKEDEPLVDELEAKKEQAGKLMREIREAEEKKRTEVEFPEMKKKEGYWKYLNSYGGPDSEKWWLYVKVSNVTPDGYLDLAKVQIDCDGLVTIRPHRKMPWQMFNRNEPATEAEWLEVVKRAQEILKNL